MQFKKIKFTTLLVLALTPTEKQKNIKYKLLLIKFYLYLLFIQYFNRTDYELLVASKQRILVNI